MVAKVAGVTFAKVVAGKVVAAKVVAGNSAKMRKIWRLCGGPRLIILEAHTHLKRDWNDPHP